MRFLTILGFVSTLLVTVEGAKQCTDSLSINNYIDVTDNEGTIVGHITDCNVLVNDYLASCKSSPGKKLCCASCKGQDLKCVDTLSKFTISRGSPGVSCRTLVDKFPCLCRDSPQVKKGCCKSCREQGDLSWCNCRDFLSTQNPLNVTFRGAKGSVETKTVTSCEEIVRDHDYLCAKGAGDIGGTGKSCCNSCKGKCVDSRTFRTTVKAKLGKRRGFPCRNCICSQIAALGAKFVQKACKRKQVKIACCAMCS